MRNATRNRLLLALFALAILFSAVAGLQYWFVDSQLRHSIISQIDNWADEIIRDLAYNDGWNLAGYRRSNPDAPIYYVATADGFFIDVVGFHEGILPAVTLPPNLIYDQPFDSVSPIGEHWRLYAVKVNGGAVVLGVPYSDIHRDTDDRLIANRKVFGESIQSAAEVTDRQVDLLIDYVVVDNSSQFRNGSGGIPISTSPRAIQHFLENGPILNINGDIYFEQAKYLTNRAGETVANVVLLKDIGLEQQMLRNSLWFNLGVAGICWLGSGLLFAIYLYGQSGRGPRITCEQALAQDEGQTIEFKSSFRWDYKQNKENKPAMEGEVIKTVAAFLNTDGGVLIIGVADDKSVLGLEADYRTITFKPNKDGFLLTLQQVLSNAFGTETFARYLRVDFCSVAGKDICVVYARPASAPKFVEEKGQKNFYVRVSNATKLLNPEELLSYVRDHFG